MTQPAAVPDSGRPAAGDPREATLLAGAKALRLELPAWQAAQLLAFVDLLARWNARINLTAVRDPQQMLAHHLMDCLAVLPAIDRHHPGAALNVLDVGSGAGLPGVVWAVMRPMWQVTCVDAVGKKATFVRQAAVELGIANLRAEHARVEQLRAGPFDLVASRAFASLPDFVRLTRHLLASGGSWLALKGATPAAEIAALTGAPAQVFHVEPLAVPGLDANRCLVWMRPAPGGDDNLR
jgi:16S rRNA (guanine527-N7)-methyltransferase